MAHIEREILFETSSPVSDAIALLSDGHKELLNLFNNYERSQSSSEKRYIAEKIFFKLASDMQTEEEIFYPAVKRVLKDKGLISAVVMHHTVLKYLLNEIKSIDTDSEIYAIKVRVLGEHVRQYVKEKQTRFFPKISATGKLDLWALGDQLGKRKEELFKNECCF